MNLIVATIISLYPTADREVITYLVEESLTHNIPPAITIGIAQLESHISKPNPGGVTVKKQCNRHTWKRCTKLLVLSVKSKLRDPNNYKKELYSVLARYNNTEHKKSYAKVASRIILRIQRHIDKALNTDNILINREAKTIDWMPTIS